MKTNIRTLFPIVFWSIYVLTACSPLITSTPILATSTTEARPTTTSTPATKYLPTYAPTETAQVFSDNLTRDCAKITSAPPSDVQLRGSLVIHSLQESVNSYILDLSTGNKISLGNSFLETVSLNGKFLAFTDLDTGSIVIADNSGAKIKNVSDPEDRLSPVYWLDNQWLLLSYRRGERGGPFIVNSWVMLDSATGNMQEWLPDYPNLDTFFSPLNWVGSARFLVNSKLTHVIYQAREDNSGLLILWDVNAEKEIARIPGIHGETPWWSPNGEKIVISLVPSDGLPFINGGDLFTIDTTGKFERLTYLTTTKFALESSYAWSPDGKAIAFMLQVSLDNKAITNFMPELSVIDMETGHVTNLCIPGYGLTWSPDGKYILLNQGLNEGREQNEVYIVDLENRLAWKIAENAEGQGWMIQQP